MVTVGPVQDGMVWITWERQECKRDSIRVPVGTSIFEALQLLGAV